MTSIKPSLSYGNAFLDDCTVATAPNYDKTESNMTMSAITVINDDAFFMTGTQTGGSPDGYWKNHTALGLSTTAYTKIRIRYKTGGAGMHVKFVADFSSGSQVLLASDSSATWKVLTVTLTPAKTLNYFEMHVMDSSGVLYVDFIQIYKDDFALPNTRHGQSLILPARYGKLNPVGMAGQYTQNLGTDLAEFQCICDLDVGSWKRAGDVMDGEVFADILHNILSTDWVWLNTGEDLAQFKASLDRPEFHRVVQESLCQRELHLLFFEYRRSSADVETYSERWGLTY